ncbi:ribosome hibernation-promoting factor, HPF/YfiA family [Acuticoccus yangtzensis]|uniref:ribosome hibernation-promoting factor, HPF/YfiA family n=1 Tax=Acuticoccus yangtzensis TaxID=1443441 RepID=UPI0009497544|nr:ribosome-associated translation inhibitor RaiA [Acuticoccus yangtzensis]ORE93096.1 Sigma 54 modulation protein/ribosomal protein S30EA [Stappia sp. 22II-S9-Z10]
MALTIAGKNMDIGDALRARIEERVEASVGKYFDGNHTGQVTVSKSGAGFDADCTIHLDTGIVLKTSASAGDATAAFEQAAERIDKRLRRYKRRLKAHKSGPSMAEVEAAAANYTVLAAPDEDEELEANYAPLVVAETPTKIKTMTVSMAVLQLDLIDAPALMFRNAANGSLNVVYRRGDGNVGWIDPSLAAGDAPAGAVKATAD